MTDQTLEPKPNSRIYGLAYSFWFLTAFLSVIVFTAGRSMIVRTYTRFFPWDAFRVQMGQGGLSLVNVLISLPLAILVIAIIIGGFEYQHRYKGSLEGWRMLTRTLAVEVGFLLLALYL
jgi:hypothetical protein